MSTIFVKLIFYFLDVCFALVMLSERDKCLASIHLGGFVVTTLFLWAIR